MCQVKNKLSEKGLKVFNIKPLQMDKIHNNTSSREKVHPLLSSHLKIHKKKVLDCFHLLTKFWIQCNWPGKKPGKFVF